MMPQYRVTVVDRIIRRFEKTITADSEDEARDIVEDQCWSVEEGWHELLDDEQIISCEIDSIELVDDEHWINEAEED